MVWYAYYATLYLFTDTLLIASCLLEYKDIKDLPTSRIKRLVPDFSSKPLVSSNTINSIQQNSPKQKNSPYFCNCFRTSRNPFCLFGCKDKARGKSCSNSSSNNDISWINVTEQKLQNLTKGPIQKRNQRHIHNDAPLLKLSTTIGTIRQYRRPVLPGSNITVKYKECGFIFCYAEDFFLNHSVQRWDYHVEWTIPNHVSRTVGPNRVFVLGNNFQLAHAYLVFRRFDRTYEGIYSCHLSFFGTVVLRADVALVFSETESEKQCVSCPGVWLPGRGRLSLSLCLLGFHTRTGRLAPIFPIMFHEKFKFDRTFVGVTNLGVLERVLESETVYLELMQEEPSGETVLAVFESSVRDLLFPRPAERLSYSGNDLDLLMEPTRDFPGIISPKIEVSTKTVVGETRTPMHQCMQDNVSFGHSQNKAIKATYQPISGKEAGKDDEENNPTNLDAESRNKAVAFESHSECSKRGNDLISGAGPKPPFAYKRPERNLLARLPESPTRNNRYLGIKSRYLSRSTGNISDLTKPSLYSRYGANKSSRQSRRRRFTDDDGHNTRVTLVEPERCPHCYEEHGAESCTTCRTYHRYFPRPDHPRPHLHAHAYHARPRYGAGGLKILKQPAYRNGRQRKRYLVDIGGADDGETFGASDERASLTRRPSSAPLTRFESTTGISADEEDDDEEDDDAEEGEVEEKEKEETKLKKPKDFSKKLSHSRSVSRSPSPPSHASAPPVLARSHYLDSDDDYLDDYTYLPRRYRYPYYKSLPRYCSYGYECPLCEQGSSRYYRRMLRDPDWCFYPKMKSYHTEPLHSKETCPICYKYNLYKPYFTYRYPSKWDPYWYKPFNLGIPPPFYRDDSCCIPFNDSDDEGRLTSWRRRRSHLRCGRKKHNIDSADEILSDVYNNENYVSGRGRDGRSRKGKNAHSAKKMHVKEYKSNGDKED